MQSYKLLENIISAIGALSHNLGQTFPHVLGLTCIPPLILQPGQTFLRINQCWVFFHVYTFLNLVCCGGEYLIYFTPKHCAIDL